MTNEELTEKVMALIKIKNAQQEELAALKAEWAAAKEVFETKKIVVKNEDSPHQVIIAAKPNIAGVYIKGKEGLVSLYNQDKQGAVIGIYGPDSAEVMDIALSAKGGPQIQINDKEGKLLYFLDVNEIKKLARGESY